MRIHRHHLSHIFPINCNRFRQILTYFDNSLSGNRKQRLAEHFGEEHFAWSWRTRSRTWPVSFHWTRFDTARCFFMESLVSHKTYTVCIGAFVISSLIHRVSDCWVACARSEAPSRNQSQGLPRDWDRHEGHCSAAVLGQEIEGVWGMQKSRTARAKSHDVQLWWSTLSFGQRSSLVKVSMSPTLVIKKFLYHSGRFATTIARTGSVCWIGASMLSWAMSLCGLCGTYVPVADVAMFLCWPGQHSPTFAVELQGQESFNRGPEKCETQNHFWSKIDPAVRILPCIWSAKDH